MLNLPAAFTNQYNLTIAPQLKAAVQKICAPKGTIKTACSSSHARQVTAQQLGFPSKVNPPDVYPFAVINDASTGIWIDGPNIVNLGYQPYNPPAIDWDTIQANPPTIDPDVLQSNRLIFTL